MTILLPRFQTYTAIFFLVASGVLTAQEYQFEDVRHSLLQKVLQKQMQSLHTPEEKSDQESATLTPTALYIPSRNDLRAALSDLYKIDTAVVRLTNDTMRYIFTHDGSGEEITEVQQQWADNHWENMYRTTTVWNNGMTAMTITEEVWEIDHWRGNERYTLWFDAAGNSTGYLSEVWWDKQWQNVDRYTVTYDAGGFPLVYLYELWYEGNWLNTYRFTITYSAPGIIETYLREEWSAGAWRNFVRDRYTSDAVGNILTSVSEEWYNEQWNMEDSIAYVYDAHSNLMQRIITKRRGDVWVNVERKTRMYDSNDRVLTELIEHWKSNQWTNVSRKTYNYFLKGGLQSMLNESWSVDHWTNVTRTTCDEDMYGNRQLYLNESWTNGAWKNSTRTVYKYDNGKFVSGTYERCFDDVWIPGDAYISVYRNGIVVRQFYGHHLIISASTVPTNVEENFGSQPKKFSLLQNYPNPFNPTTEIRYQIPEASRISLKVYDLLGKEVAVLIDGVKEAGSHIFSFNAAELPSGVYFYILRSDNTVATKKMLLLK